MTKRYSNRCKHKWDYDPGDGKRNGGLDTMYCVRCAILRDPEPADYDKLEAGKFEVLDPAYIKRYSMETA